MTVLRLLTAIDVALTVLCPTAALAQSYKPSDHGKMKHHQHDHHM
jgi:hypothetical protein